MWDWAFSWGLSGTEFYNGPCLEPESSSSQMHMDNPHMCMHRNLVRAALTTTAHTNTQPSPTGLHSNSQGCGNHCRIDINTNLDTSSLLFMVHSVLSLLAGQGKGCVLFIFRYVLNTARYRVDIQKLFLKWIHFIFITRFSKVTITQHLLLVTHPDRHGTCILAFISSSPPLHEASSVTNPCFAVGQIRSEKLSDVPEVTASKWQTLDVKIPDSGP